MKLFVVSDIHSFFDEFYNTLRAKGFERNNPDHLLVCCGDCFDRGPAPREVMDYLMGLENVVLIRGNHEDLFEDLCARGYPRSHDIHNGTWDTICDLNGIGPEEVVSMDYRELCQEALVQVQPFFDKMVDYFETKNYVFVHACLPLFFDDWRKLPLNSMPWQDARWGNPFDFYKYNPQEKVIVFGHWHCSAGWARDEGREEFGTDAIFEPYYGDKYIAIDACTAYSGQVNVLVIEDELL